MGLISKLLLFISFLLSGSLLLAYMAPFIPPTKFSLPTLLGLIHPALLLLNAISVIFWGLKKNIYAFVFLGVILMGWTHIKGFIGFNYATPTQTESVKIMSYNVARLHNIKEISKRNDAQGTYDELLAYLKSEKPDILCVGEMNLKFIKDLKKDLDMPYVASTETSSKGEVLTIYSKYKIVNSKDIKFQNSYNGNMYADIDIKGEIYRVFNIHLESNKVTNLTHNFTGSEIENKERVKRASSILKRFSHSATLRENQARAISEHINDTEFPVIVCGDFNDTPISYAYRILSKGLVDTFKEKGKGIGSTFAGNIPALKIDYILVSPEIEVVSHQIDRVLFSDHYPQSAEIRID